MTITPGPNGPTESAGLENTRPSYRVENARLENARPIYTGGKRGTIIQVGGKRETSSYGTPMIPVL